MELKMIGPINIDIRSNVSNPRRLVIQDFSAPGQAGVIEVDRNLVIFRNETAPERAKTRWEKIKAFFTRDL